MYTDLRGSSPLPHWSKCKCLKSFCFKTKKYSMYYHWAKPSGIIQSVQFTRTYGGLAPCPFKLNWLFWSYTGSSPAARIEQNCFLYLHWAKPRNFFSSIHSAKPSSYIITSICIHIYLLQCFIEEKSHWSPTKRLQFHHMASNCSNVHESKSSGFRLVFWKTSGLSWTYINIFI